MKKELTFQSFEESIHSIFIQQASELPQMCVMAGVNIFFVRSTSYFRIVIYSSDLWCVKAFSLTLPYIIRPSDVFFRPRSFSSEAYKRINQHQHMIVPLNDRGEARSVAFSCGNSYSCHRINVFFVLVKYTYTKITVNVQPVT